MEAEKLRTTGISAQPKFHSAILQYGFENFYWEVLCECNNQRDLDYNERLAREWYEKHGGIYNTDRKLTNATVAKLSGRKRSPETIAKMRKPHKKFSPEARHNMRMVQIGISKSEDHKRKIGESVRATSAKPESRKKRSDSAKARVYSYREMLIWSAAAKRRWAKKLMDKEQNKT